MKKYKEFINEGYDEHKQISKLIDDRYYELDVFDIFLRGEMKRIFNQDFNFRHDSYSSKFIDGKAYLALQFEAGERILSKIEKDMDIVDFFLKMKDYFSKFNYYKIIKSKSNGAAFIVLVDIEKLIDNDNFWNAFKQVFKENPTKNFDLDRYRKIDYPDRLKDEMENLFDSLEGINKFKL